METYHKIGHRTISYFPSTCARIDCAWTTGSPASVTPYKWFHLHPLHFLEVQTFFQIKRSWLLFACVNVCFVSSVVLGLKLEVRFLFFSWLISFVHHSQVAIGYWAGSRARSLVLQLWSRHLLAKPLSAPSERSRHSVAAHILCTSTLNRSSFRPPL